MPALLDLIARAQTLRLHPDSQAAKVIEDALHALLLAEGPAPQPIDGFSEDLQTGIARSTFGRIRFLAHTWTTGPWRCLLLDLNPVPMGRPQLLMDKDTKKSRVTVDYPSRKMQQQIKFACTSLNLPPPPEPSRFVTAFDKHRTFIAWTGYSEDVSVLKGDLDNYAKNVLDGLQRSGLVRNDKTVASLLAVNCPMSAPVRTLDDYLCGQITDHLQEHPGATPKRIAKALNIPVQRSERLYRALSATVQELRLNLVRQHLQANPGAKPAQIAQATRLATSTVSLLIPLLGMPENEPLTASEDPSTPSNTPSKVQKGQGAGAKKLPLTSNIPQDLVPPARDKQAGHARKAPLEVPAEDSAGLDASNSDLLDVSQAP